MIGQRPIVEQQRILFALLALGLVGLVGLAIYSFVAARARLDRRWPLPARR